MAGRKLLAAPALVLLVALLAGYIDPSPFIRAPRVLGFVRSLDRTEVAAAEEFVAIPDTTHCEDLHYHEKSRLLFTACEVSAATRHSWFPGLGIFDGPEVALAAQGKIEVIDPQTMKAKQLTFEGFEGPFVTHGIDVLDDPAAAPGTAVYIFAVNHVPNAKYYADKDVTARKSRSVVEVFRHKIGSSTAQHVRTVYSDMISTPNDVLALSPHSFLVTNDHYYTEGHMRTVEDVYFGAKWSKTFFVDFSVDKAAKVDDSYGVNVSLALDNIHNNNGIGRGKAPEEVVVVSAASGVVHFGELSQQGGGTSIRIVGTFEADSSLDNPSYFSDPFASSSSDGSGYIQCGLSRAADLAKNSRNPNGKDGIMVWHVSETANPAGPRRWSGRLLFEDDASRVRSCSAAVLVAIDPAKEQGRRRAWLFIAGFLAKNVVAVKIDLAP